MKNEQYRKLCHFTAFIRTFLVYIFVSFFRYCIFLRCIHLELFSLLFKLSVLNSFLSFFILYPSHLVCTSHQYFQPRNHRYSKRRGGRSWECNPCQFMQKILPSVKFALCQSNLELQNQQKLWQKCLASAPPPPINIPVCVCK